MIYVDVIVPLPLSGTFTYSVPGSLSEKAEVGSRVIIQFGKRKFYTGIISRIYEKDTPEPGIKEITALLDDRPVVLPRQIAFWEWIASYYMCTVGEVYKAALPSALKLESETLVFLNEDFEADERFTPNEEKVFHSLPAGKPLRISEIENKTKIANAIPYVKSLAEKGAVFIDENIGRRYAVKTETAVRLKENYSDEELSVIAEELKRAKKQQQLFLFFLGLREEAEDGKDFFVFKKRLVEESGISPAVLDALVARGYLETFPFEVSRFNYGLQEISSAKELNPFQEKAYKDIKKSFLDKDITLLHGITSSGKTEIYIQLIKEAFEKGGNVLYLLPEIALTTQITERLRSVFGEKLLVYHSRFNENERAETWYSLLNSSEPKVVLGARSAVFLPFRELSLVIIDEEHESSYKQQDPAPRYNARNAAIVLASMYKAKTLLGTATPSIETYFNAQSGKYGLVELNMRHEEIELPEIVVINTKELRRRKQMKTLLSPPLIHDIKTVLEKKEQIILFQNRRGFAPLLECKTCAWTPLCQHCDVSLTYHKGQHAMVCHYCGAAYPIPLQCPNCETPTLEMQGYGTERVEEMVSEEFPGTGVVRMDLDTTRSKRAYENIISDFASNKSNILIGTQMISKGLDFDNVSLVGILSADSMLNYPDFRAYERAFQLMMQVSGRAGRKNKRGRVLLQTAHPGHPIISYIKNHDYLSFYETQLEERRMFRYPPFYRLIEIVMKHKEENVVESMSLDFGRLLRQSFDDRVLGPAKPGVARVQSLYIRKIILKIENHASPVKIRETIESYRKYIQANPKYKSVLLYYNVDPV